MSNGTRMIKKNRGLSLSRDQRYWIAINQIDLAEKEMRQALQNLAQHSFTFIERINVVLDIATKAVLGEPLTDDDRAILADYRKEQEQWQANMKPSEDKSEDSSMEKTPTTETPSSEPPAL